MKCRDRVLSLGSLLMAVAASAYFASCNKSAATSATDAAKAAAESGSDQTPSPGTDPQGSGAASDVAVASGSGSGGGGGSGSAGSGSGSGSGTGTGSGVTSGSASPAPTNFTIVGKVNLVGDATDTGTLVAGSEVEDAIVFLEGFPMQSATTDVHGAFVLQIDLSDGMSLLDAANYRLLAWKVSDGTNQYKFGVAAKFAAAPGDRVELATVLQKPFLTLTYTMKRKFRLMDGATQIASNTCGVTILGYEGKLASTVVSGGSHNVEVDYMPATAAGELYHYIAHCDGYQPSAEGTFEVPQSLSSGNWVQPVIEVPLTI